MTNKNDRYDGFDDWVDVQGQFSMSEPEPTEVLAAIYNRGGYEGDATVIYRKGRKYYINSGSHCSCYGLENQWSPEEYATKKLLIEVLKKGSWGAADSAYNRALEILQK